MLCRKGPMKLPWWVTHHLHESLVIFLFTWHWQYVYIVCGKITSTSTFVKASNLFQLSDFSPGGGVGIVNRAVVSLFGLTCAYRNKITQSVKIWSKWAMGFIFFFAFAVLSGIQTCREVKLFPKLLVHFVKMQVSNNQHNWPKHHITCKLFFVFETMFKMMFFLQKWLLQKFNFLNQFEMFVLFTNNNIYCIFTKCSNLSFSTIFVSVLGVGCFLVTSKVGGLYIPLCVCGFFLSH